MSELWYAVRTAPGACRPDRRDDRFMKIERELMDHGFDFYLPMEVRDIVHHRTKKLVQKRFPLVPGYAFVCSVTNFWKLSECKTVSGVLGIDGEPLPLLPKEIDDIRRAETDIFGELARERRKRAMEKQKLNRKRLAGLYPSGSQVVVNTGFLSAEQGRVVATTGRKTVKLTLDRLANLGIIELPVDDCRLVA